MYDITKEISVFAVHSTSLFRPRNKNVSTCSCLPVGKSNEVGVKVDLLNGKITARSATTRSTKSVAASAIPTRSIKTRSSGTANGGAAGGCTSPVPHPRSAAGPHGGSVTWSPPELGIEGLRSRPRFPADQGAADHPQLRNNSEQSTNGVTRATPSRVTSNSKYSRVDQYTYGQGD